MSVLKLDDLIAKKMQSEKDKYKVSTYYSESLEGSIELHKVDDDIVFDTIDMIGNNESTRQMVKAYDFLIYNAVPILRKPELLTAYECVEPTEIVSKLFNLTERIEIGTAILELCGFSQKQDDVKKQ